MVVFKYPYLFNHMELEGDLFCSQSKICVDFDQGAHFCATPAQEEETTVQNRKNSQVNRHHHSPPSK